VNRSAGNMNKTLQTLCTELNFHPASSAHKPRTFFVADVITMKKLYIY